jgi:uncharacterized protein YdaU (DUF1376 family)
MHPKLLYLPFSISTWDRLTDDLTDRQERAFYRLIAHYATHGELPKAETALANIARQDLRTWRKMRAALAGKFPNGGWEWPEIDQLIAHREKLSGKRSVAGSIGNYRRWKTR